MHGEVWHDSRIIQRSSIGQRMIMTVTDAPRAIVPEGPMPNHGMRLADSGWRCWGVWSLHVEGSQSGLDARSSSMGPVR